MNRHGTNKLSTLTRPSTFHCSFTIVVMDLQPSSNSLVRIETWVDAVASAAQPEQSNTQRHLRPRLAPITSNSRLRKHNLAEEAYEGFNTARKRTKVMADNTHDEVVRRGRGRPRGSGLMRGQGPMRGQQGQKSSGHLGLIGESSSAQEQRSGDQQISVPTLPEDYAPSFQSSMPSRSRSPSKQLSKTPSKRGKAADKPKSDASIDMVYLEACSPSVELVAPKAAIQEGPLPQLVKDLYKDVVLDPPKGFIPAALQVNDRTPYPSLSNGADITTHSHTTRHSQTHLENHKLHLRLKNICPPPPTYSLQSVLPTSR